MPPEDLPYFAYGSNLDPVRFAERCPDHTDLGTAWLAGHRAAFAGRSTLWGGGVGTVRRSLGHSVPGTLYALGPQHWATLDRIEGHPHFYKRVRVTVSGQLAWTYLLPEDLPEHPPTPDYLAAVIAGRSARRWNPDDWLAAETHAHLHTDARN